jgi:hypothetical protein
MTVSNQFGRKVGLYVGTSSKGLDLSALEIQFKTCANDFNAPNIAYIRVFNPSPQTVGQIEKEFDTVSLQAGYEEGNYGIIFQGTIMQVRTGKLENVTRFIDIKAADADLFHSFGVVNISVAPDTAQKDVLNKMKPALEANGVTIDPVTFQALTPSGGILPRGKVLHGMGKNYISTLADKANARWYIENGVLKIVPLTGYLQGEAVVINSQTGLIGVPEATENGIYVKTLLNPKIQVGNTVKLNNAEIIKNQVNQQGFPTYQSTSFFASLSPDGLYTVMVKEHTGGNRTNPFYTDLVCLAIDQSSGKVAAYG